MKSDKWRQAGCSRPVVRLKRRHGHPVLLSCRSADETVQCYALVTTRTIRLWFDGRSTGIRLLVRDH